MVDDAAKDRHGPGTNPLAGGRTAESRRPTRPAWSFFHIPLFDPRGGENHHCLRPELATRLVALFKKYRVTHVFAGHIHSYYTGAWDGVPYTITAGAGAKLYGTDPQHVFYHYLKVTIQGEPGPDPGPAP